jgi:hypothetical protein
MTPALERAALLRLAAAAREDGTLALAQPGDAASALAALQRKQFSGLVAVAPEARFLDGKGLRDLHQELMRLLLEQFKFVRGHCR